MGNYIPKRGDIIWMSFNPVLGHEQAGQRPAIILSNDKYNNVTGMAIVCPITNQVKGYVGEISLPLGTNIKGVVLCNHIRNIDWAERKVRFSGETLNGDFIDAILERINLICSP